MSATARNAKRIFKLSILIFTSLSGCYLYGQAQSGSISGSISDPNGALLPGTAVRAVQKDTGARLDTVSSEAGIYVFPNLPTGIWTISAEKTGFKKSVSDNVEVFIAQRQTCSDIKMQIGDMKQTVEVSANQTLLDTETSEKGESMTPKMYQTLPLWSGGLQNPSAFLGYMSGVNGGARNKHRRVHRSCARTIGSMASQQRNSRIGRHSL